MNQADQLATTQTEQITAKLQEVDVNKISSPTLARLIEEVRNEEVASTHMYNRTHNRHNRSR